MLTPRSVNFPQARAQMGYRQMAFRQTSSGDAKRMRAVLSATQTRCGGEWNPISIGLQYILQSHKKRVDRLLTAREDVAP
jgi:hypothetical protein